MPKNPSFEMISYQVNDSFVPAAERIVAAIFSDIRNKLYKSPRDLLKRSPKVMELSQLIKDRFNIENEISGDLISLSSMAVIPYFNINKSFESFTGFTFKYVSDFLKAAKKIEKIEAERRQLTLAIDDKKGFVNVKEARVGGYLSQLKTYFIFNFHDMYNEDFTPANAVAVMLHEIGHAFSGLEYHYLLESSNFTLRQMMVEINKNDLEKAVYLFNTKASKEDMIHIKDLNSITRYDMTFKLFSRYFKTIKSQLINSKYNETGFENLADSFATRFGMGKDLAESLSKLYKNAGQEHTKAWAIRNSIFEFLLFIWAMSFLALLFMSGFLFFGALLFIAIIFGSGSSTENMTYDNLADRYQRIRNTMVNQLKSTVLSDATLTKELLDGISQVDTFISSTFEIFSTRNFIADKIFSKDRDASYYKAYQRDLEDLGNNSLFLQAGRLSLI